MRYELKKIGLWAFVKVAFFVNMILGFLIGILYAMFFGFFMAVLQNMPYLPDQGMEPPADAPIGIVMVMLPFLFALIGGFIYTVLGMLIVIVYNLVVKVTGGIEFNLESIVEVVPVTPPAYAQPQAPAYSTPPPPPPIAEPAFEPPPQHEPPSAEHADPQNKDNNDYPTRTVGG